MSILYYEIYIDLDQTYKDILNMNFVEMLDDEIIRKWASYYINYKDIFQEFEKIQNHH